MSGPLSQQPGQLHPFLFLKSEPGSSFIYPPGKKYSNHSAMALQRTGQRFHNHPAIRKHHPFHPSAPFRPATPHPLLTIRGQSSGSTVQSETAATNPHRKLNHRSIFSSQNPLSSTSPARRNPFAEKILIFFSFSCNLLPLCIELFMKLQMKPPWQGLENFRNHKDFTKKHLQKRATFGKLKTELFHIVGLCAFRITTLQNEQKN